MDSATLDLGVAVNDELQMTNDERSRMTNVENPRQYLRVEPIRFGMRNSSFFRHWVSRYSSLFVIDDRISRSKWRCPVTFARQDRFCKIMVACGFVLRDSVIHDSVLDGFAEPVISLQ